MRLFRNWLAFIVNYIRNPDIPMTVCFRNGMHICLRPGTSDFLIIREVLVWGDYEPPGFEIDRDFTVVDIGAQIGVFTVMAGRKAISGRVLSFEPHPDNFSLLQSNVSANELHQVKTYNRAVASTEGPLKFYVSSFNTGGHSIVASGGSQVELIVDAVRLEDILKGENISHIDYLKMDCEGAEVQILRSLASDTLRRISRIVMEIHDPVDATADGLTGWLQKQGFEVQVRGTMVYAHQRATALS